MPFVRSLSTQRIALIALIALPAILLTLRSGLERREESAGRVREQGLQVARGIAQQGELSVNGARDLLKPIAALFGDSTGVAGVSTEACTTFLSTFVGPESEYVSVGLATTSGRVHCASTALREPIQIADQPFFRAAMGGNLATVGHFATDPISGQPALTVGWPVVGAAGARLGVVFAGIDLERLQPVELLEGLPRGSYAAVTDSTGTILARVPDPQSLVGTKVRDAGVLEAIRRLREGTTEGLSAEGVHSLIAFTPIQGFGSGAYAVIGIPSAAAFADANEALRQDLIVLGLISFIALSAGWIVSERFVLQPVASLVRVTRRIAVGDFTARVGTPYAPNEIGELSHAFDTMAAALAARQEEIEELNATLERRVEHRTADLAEANEELEAFSYSVSHDLRGPLRTIDGYAEILATDYGSALDADGQRYLASLRGAAQHMDRLIDDLLQFSRVGRAGLNRRHLPLEPIVRDALEELHPDIGDRPVEIEIQPLGEALVDPALIRQVYVNLLANAIKFTRSRDPASVVIGAERGTRGESIYFVRDNGVGFDMEQSGELFQVFHRLHSQSEYEGTGVGLATVHRIITRHRGRIWAESEVDRGTTLLFTLGSEPDGDD